MKPVVLHEQRETRRFAGALARSVMRFPHPRTRALVIALVGELGAGKTTFTRAFARALGCRRSLTSPTFLIMRRYALPRGVGRYRSLVHVDAYRLPASPKPQRGEPAARQLRGVGVTEALADPHAIVLIEWADRIARALPRGRITLTFHHGAHEHERRVAVAPARWYKEVHHAAHHQGTSRLGHRS